MLKEERKWEGGRERGECGNRPTATRGRERMKEEETGEGRKEERREEENKNLLSCAHAVSV